MTKTTKPQTNMGFTLIELLVTLAIISTLAAIAYPNYIKFKTETRRAEATTTLIGMQSTIQNYLIATNSEDLTTVPPSLLTPPITTKYKITFTTATPPNYTITATVISTGTQKDDTNCAKFMIDNNGGKTSTNSANAPSTGCW